MWPTKSEAQRKPAQASSGDLFAPLTPDLYLAHHLFRRGRSVRLLDGITGFAERRDRIRREIVDARLADVFRFGERSAPSTETFAQAFARLYGESL